jgi:hypothetical protein
MDDKIDIEEWMPGITECLEAAARDHVVSSYQGRLLDVDDREIASVQVRRSSAAGEPAWWVVYTDPQDPRHSREQNPSVLEQWDYPTKHRYPILRHYECPNAASHHFHIATGDRQCLE